MRVQLTATVAVLLLTPSLARAQAPLTPGAAPATTADPSAVSRAAQEAAEDLALIRVLTALRLAAPQLAELLPLLQDAQNRLQALDAENAASIARHKQALEESRDLLLAGKPPSTRTETQYAETLQLADTKRTKLRADLTGLLKRALAKHLGSQQEALLVQVARAISTQERTAGWRVQATTGGRGAGGGGGGPADFMGNLMDRIRQMSPEEFNQQQGRFAGRLGGENPQQMAGMLAQIRAMSPEAYAQQRANLSMQLFDQRVNAGRGNTPADQQAEIDRFVERYFLSPRIVPVVRQQLGGR